MGLDALEFSRVAARVVEVAARVQPTERVCVITDFNKLKIAEALAAACGAIGAETVVCVMAPGQMHGNEPPDVIAAAMKAAEVLIVPTTYALTHTAATQAALKSGVRMMILREITEDTFLHGGITADYEEVDARTNLVADRLEAADEIRVTTTLGTNVTMSKRGRPVFRASGLLKGGRKVTGLPQGEAAIAPVAGTAEGVIVVDHAIDNIGLLSTLVRLVVANGRVVDVSGGKEARQLETFIKENQNGDNIGEFAIGTNPCCRLLDNVCEAKYRLGVVHMAVGSNLLLGGNVAGPMHLDMVILRPTVFLDGQEVIHEGDLLI